MQIPQLVKLLTEHYAAHIRHELAERPVLDQLIQTLLSQKTTSGACAAAFSRLRADRDWEQVSALPRRGIIAAIQPAGLADQKADRILEILDRVCAEFGAHTLEPLRQWETDRVIAWLSALPGVGPKTTACVLLFALARPVLPVDTHLHRVTIRLGILPPETPLAKAGPRLERVIPPADRLIVHVGLYEHGRRVCKARRPDCGNCVLVGLCAEGQRRLG